jgi:hypothetical protein
MFPNDGLENISSIQNYQGLFPQLGSLPGIPLCNFIVPSSNGPVKVLNCDAGGQSSNPAHELLLFFYMTSLEAPV